MLLSYYHSILPGDKSSKYSNSSPGLVFGCYFFPTMVSYQEANLQNIPTLSLAWYLDAIFSYHGIIPGGKSLRYSNPSLGLVVGCSFYKRLSNFHITRSQTYKILLLTINWLFDWNVQTFCMKKKNSYFELSAWHIHHPWYTQDLR